MYDTVQSELEEKIRRLEEDRHSIDITSGGCKFKVVGGFLLLVSLVLLFCLFFFNLLVAADWLTVHIVCLVSFRLSNRMLFSCRLWAEGLNLSLKQTLV